MQDGEIRLEGHIVDLVNRKITDGELCVRNGNIYSITPKALAKENLPYIMPGFVDSHIHIESSMLLPSNFAEVAVRFGTVGVVCDPHEIANVLGKKGIEFMIEDGKNVNFHFYNGAPSCVPATSFETSGESLNSKDVASLLKNDDIFLLSEMMNYPGVLFKDEEVMKKISAANKYNKVIDGHAPGLMGENLKTYASQGISTDHECSTIEEAQEKIKCGMNILIREGSAAKNFKALIPLMKQNPEKLMFCSDDKHPDDLILGHINLLVKRAIEEGYDVFDVLRSASLNPKQHYKLSTGLLQEGDNADFILVNNLQEFNILSTFINGKEVFNKEEGIRKDNFVKSLQGNYYPNNFHANPITQKDIEIHAKGENIRVIECFDGEIFTKETIAKAKIENDKVVSDVDNDILKIVVMDRYTGNKPQTAFIKGFGFKQGAIASSVAHDSHNVIAVGVSDEEIVRAMNMVIENEGGISIVCKEKTDILHLPIAGLISEMKAPLVAKKYKELNQTAKTLSNKLQAPYMTLSFMALLVIPELKLSDKGLFDGKNFQFTQLFVS